MKKIKSLTVFILFLVISVLSVFAFVGCKDGSSSDDSEISFKYQKLVWEMGEYDEYGIGLAKTPTKLSDIVIPSEYNGKPITKIAYRGFYNLKSNIIDENTWAEREVDFFYDEEGNKVQAKDPTSDNGLKWKKNDENRYVDENGNELAEKDWDKRVPVYVMKIERYHPYRIFTITIPNGVTSIGSEAFKGCKNFKFILPTSLTYIDFDGFSDVTNCSIEYLGTKAQWRTRVKGYMPPTSKDETRNVKILCSDGELER